MWGAVAGCVINNNTQYELAVSVHDSVYNTDFESTVIPYNPNNPDKNAKEIEQYVLQTFRKFSIEHLCKFLGVGITLSLLKEVGFGEIAIEMTYLTFLIQVSQCLYSSMVGHGYCALCLQHQGLPY